MTEYFGRGIAYRLQGARALPAQQDTASATTFDLEYWAANSNLTSLGLELYVSQGSARLRLWHEDAKGHRSEITDLDSPTPGSQFSPPLQLAGLAEKGGRLLAELLSPEADAGTIDIYFGTNDLPTTPSARIAYVLPPQAETKRLTAWFNAVLERHAPLRLRDHCLLLPAPQAKSDSGWQREALYEAAYGTHSDKGITHLAIVPADIDVLGFDTFEEMVLRSLGLAFFLRDPPLSQAPNALPWPVALIDLHQIYCHGLPPSGPSLDLSAYLAWIHTPEIAGAAQSAFRRTGRLRTLFPNLFSQSPEVSPMLARSRLALSRQLRRQAQNSHHALHHLEQRLGPLWDMDRLEADRDRANRLALSLLRDRHKGCRAVIVGNGPSLTISDLDRLQGEVTFASNKIYLAYPETSWRPTYYSVEDHLVLQNNWHEIKALQGSLKLFPANTRDYGYHAADTVFAPFLPPHSFADPLSDPEFPAFSSDLVQGISWGSTIVYSQIQMAVFMGCQEIVLIGLDHSYQLPDTKDGNTYRHAGEQNHFHPGYRTPGELWHQPNLDVLEVSYTRARQICNERGIRIVNASRRSELGVFDRVDFDQVFPAEDPLKDMSHGH
ncbi:hypothetical protein PXK00_16795 [Phaeobacter sp. QD34_3]|uniref:hypothetical protein n=1 Tax=unclassified Phaeobacter TaxID=2621772 RepID=UPI00237FA2FD|nr:MULTISPECIES: hypothetical protein [unclassified Phaeobacter]MDE4134778.1 hypothetical protein [Phaeobacter sp. QD34_3]MDE4138436.1 hypothetical protein [Phaeobacter sp. QD34_24]